MTDTYAPRLTSVEKVLRAMRLGEDPTFADGTDYRSDVLAAIESAEDNLAVDLGDDLQVAGADASARVLRCGHSGYLQTPPMAAEPTGVELLTDRTDASGSALDNDDWYVSRPARGALPGCHLMGDIFGRGSWYRVTARWGWPRIPAVLDRVAQLDAVALYRRERAQVGVPSTDPDADLPMPALADYDRRRLLRPVRRRLAGAGV